MTPTCAPHGPTSPQQHAARQKLSSLFANRPMPDEELLTNMGLYMRSSALAKLLFLDELYRNIIDIPGCIVVFGAWWGQDVVVLHNLRAIHEPYNLQRRVLTFDTFEGYPSPGEKDIPSGTITKGGYHTAPGYPAYLDELLSYHNEENVLGHIPKHEIIVGDATHTTEAYFAAHPESLVALAYLDMALYEPTKRVLELLLPRMVKGSVLSMDQLNSAKYPGETLAYREVVGIKETMLRKSRFLPDRTYAVL